MSLAGLVVGGQNSNFSYGPCGPFASQNQKARPFADLEFSHILEFLEPKELADAESVCRSWKCFIEKTHQWKKQCQNQLNTSEDPITYLPPYTPGDNYKQRLQTVLFRVLDQDQYRYILGAKVDSAPRIPETLSLKRFKEPDPWAPTETRGQLGYWMYIPPCIEITVNGDSLLDLDKFDDPNDREAPRLIQKEAGLVEKFSRLAGLGTESEKRVLKVPVTINNIRELFKHPKNGYPSDYAYIWDNITEQHGNERIASGWIYMRGPVAARNQNFARQQTVAKEAKMIIPSLGQRILLNFLIKARTNAYPDGQKPWTFVRTLTLTRDSQGNDRPSGCGAGGPSGLGVYDTLGRDNVGVAVALPAEIQDIGL